MLIRLSEEENMWVAHPVGPAFPSSRLKIKLVI